MLQPGQHFRESSNPQNDGNHKAGVTRQGVIIIPRSPAKYPISTVPNASRKRDKCGRAV